MESLKKNWQTHLHEKEEITMGLMAEYYFPRNQESLLDEIIFKFIRMGFDNFDVMTLGAGSVLTIYKGGEHGVD